MDQPLIRLGTSAFTADGWEGSFYPKGLPACDQLCYYAQHFDIVEVDSTFYRVPSLATVKGWNAKTPKGFLFAAKVPQKITHEKALVSCDNDLAQFLKVMDALGDKLGPLLFQFPYFNKKAFLGVNDLDLMEFLYHGVKESTSQQRAVKPSLVEPAGYRPPGQTAYSRAPSAVSWCCTPPATSQSRFAPPSASKRSLH
jgi:uncharacterized protein YecE (DUF72 family)